MTAAAADRTRLILYGVAGLLLLRAAVAAALPLAFDEAYYWMWSRHLAAGYYDHPPAIAYVIRFGTVLFGDTSLGVRAGAVLLSAAASWSVWRAGTILTGDRRVGTMAALLFTLMPMITAQTMLATPDAPAIAASAFFLHALALVEKTGQSRWWIAAGAAAGFALLSKYTGLFLGAGALLWLLAAPAQRRWMTTPWPYLGAVLALVMFAPVVAWNAASEWVSFAKQFGRVTGEGGSLRYTAEFVGAQLGLATPFILILGIMGMFFRRGASSLPAALCVPAVLYFLWHSLHGRVEGNWPSFLYPMLAVAAGGAAVRLSGWTWRLVAAPAIPLAGILVLGLYAQALWGVIPWGRGDPTARMLAAGYDGIARTVDDLRAQHGATAVLTSSYAQTAWLSFYLPSRAPVIPINEPERWRTLPVARLIDHATPFLYVTETRRDQADTLRADFDVEQIEQLARARNGVFIEEYAIYRVSAKGDGGA